MSSHPSPGTAKACEDINARAFTVGNHIAFNHGEYDPSSAESQHTNSRTCASKPVARYRCSLKRVR
ncbi:DUF4157 domain-containing protein [Halogeometricum borinquense]|uniref:eCIS core domain-containing protein n=1 Tax=Halogeometricum borinquense TaxID=60847 RepID=UPI003438BD5A